MISFFNTREELENLFYAWKVAEPPPRKNQSVMVLACCSDG
jgi:hypothetical protein